MRRSWSIIGVAVLAALAAVAPSAANAAYAQPAQQKLNSRAVHQLESDLSQSSAASFAGVSVDQAHGLAVFHVKQGTDVAAFTAGLKARMGGALAVAAKGASAATEADDPARLTAVVQSERYSLADLDGMRQQAVGSEWTPGLAKRLSIDYVDPATNHVVIGLTSVTGADRAQARKAFGSGVELIQRNRAVQTTRIAESPSYWDGIRINRNNNQNHCTAGFDVLKGGSRYFLTAGHCGPSGSYWYNNGNYIGWESYISYSADGYDSALIGGGDYGAWMWDGCPTCVTAQPIKGVSYPNIGNYVCLNGSYTGSYCTTYLQLQNICVTFTPGLRTCHLNETESSDPTQAGRSRATRVGRSTAMAPVATSPSASSSVRAPPATSPTTNPSTRFSVSGERHSSPAEPY